MTSLEPPREPRRWGAPPRSLSFVRLYPAEGDSAIAELMCGEVEWGSLQLEGIDLNALGAARTANAHVVLRLVADRGWELELEHAVALLRAAEAWLIENEQGRVPLVE